jgi:hypothetical protein
MKYIGQTGRSFYQRYDEYGRDFKTGNEKSAFVKHLIDNSHTMGTIESTESFITYFGITKIYYRKTVGHIFTKPVETEGTTQNFFSPVCCFSS